MITKQGYVKQSKTRVVDSPIKAIYNVVYDREYLTEYLHTKVCEPLFVLGKEDVLKLVEESWDTYYGENAVVLPSKRAKQLP